MGKTVGIDLGTTNSAIAVIDGPRPRVIRSREDRDLVCSVVSTPRMKKGQTATPEDILRGDPAYDNWPVAPEDTILSIKRLMGRGFGDPEVQRAGTLFPYKVVPPSDGTADSVRVVMGGQEYSPVDISAMILRKLKEDAEFACKEEVTQAVITVPAYFDEAQKDATRKAGVKAGMKVLSLISEPTAVAIAYGLECTTATDSRCILVYDLGGGTFDVSLLLWEGGMFTVANTEGDMWLGGDNFDELIVNYLLSQVAEEPEGAEDHHAQSCSSSLVGRDKRFCEAKHDLWEGKLRTNSKFMARLKKEARKVKEVLTTSAQSRCTLEAAYKNTDDDWCDFQCTVTRTAFETWSSPMIDRTLSIVDLALKNAGLPDTDVDDVILAGSASAMPQIQNRMTARFGDGKIRRGQLHPKLAVAQGAAIVAARLSGAARAVCICGVENESSATKCASCSRPFTEAPTGEPSSRDYGVLRPDGGFRVFIKKNSPVPTPEQDIVGLTFHTRYANQRMIAVPVFAGINLAAVKATPGRADGEGRPEKQGEAFAVLPPDLPKDEPIRIRLWLADGGSFCLTAHLERTGIDLKPWIMRGEKDAQGLQAWGSANQAIERAIKSKRIDKDKAKELRDRADKALDALQNGKLDEALTVAQGVVEETGVDADADPVARANSLQGYVKFLISQYDWLLDEAKTTSIRRLDAKVESNKLGFQKSETAATKRALVESVRELDLASDDIPLEIVFLMQTNALASRLHAFDPDSAAQFALALEAIIQSKVKTEDASLRALQGLALIYICQKGGFECPQHVEVAQATPGACRVCNAPLKLKVPAGFDFPVWTYERASFCRACIPELGFTKCVATGASREEALERLKPIYAALMKAYRDRGATPPRERVLEGAAPTVIPELATMNIATFALLLDLVSKLFEALGKEKKRVDPSQEAACPLSGCGAPMREDGRYCTNNHDTWIGDEKQLTINQIVSSSNLKGVDDKV